ncbi:GCN5 family acetyltransferase [Thermotoga sp. Ku-13t]|uniref:GNAT family N-acetyltransferase n=1 Tax=Thermotoga sp. Ku-13t TaxID=1755813 RepID=UPI0013EDC456|nr:GNAT family protein [Thermotoga sp. Ku-13t]KAF2957856.1 GCN5 family acetyltransferase [Thermotoga sp. Ku-13t]
MRFEISDAELVKIATDELRHFSETRFLNFPRKIVLNFFENDQPIGFVSFDVRWINRNAYITYYLIPEKRGKGLGKAMVLEAIKFAFDTLNMNRITAEVYEYNDASIALLRSVGFELEGVMKKAKYHAGRYHDIHIYGLLRENFGRE